jgi:hypothetical protein
LGSKLMRGAFCGFCCCRGPQGFRVYLGERRRRGRAGGGLYGFAPGSVRGADLRLRVGSGNGVTRGRSRRFQRKEGRRLLG